ncbi:hypothetical protein CNY89_23100, partial [Amaricoccus sp. HAR-UPW-R2A-40]
ATVCYDGYAAFVIYNNTHAPVRQASNIAHELAHIVLGHPPLPLIKADGRAPTSRSLKTRPAGSARRSWYRRRRRFTL